MTEKLTDLEECVDGFDDVRSRIKIWLGQDAFFDMRNEMPSSYRLPVFRFLDTVGKL
jgi:hypothetical protein